jgi:hypothetical protein
VINTLRDPVSLFKNGGCRGGVRYLFTRDKHEPFLVHVVLLRAGRGPRRNGRHHDVEKENGHKRAARNACNPHDLNGRPSTKRSQILGSGDARTYHNACAFGWGEYEKFAGLRDTWVGHFGSGNRCSS